MSAQWLIRKDSDPDPAHPWYFTYLPEEDACGAGGHYGSMPTMAEAVRAVQSEARDHATRLSALADPHRAFHVRSMLPMPSSLCTRCRPALPVADSLLGMARPLIDRITLPSRVNPEDARTLARIFRELDAHLSGGGRPPEEWREGPDAVPPELADVIDPHTGQPYVDDEPPGSWGPTAAQEEAWDAREDFARESVLGACPQCDRTDDCECDPGIL